MATAERMKAAADRLIWRPLFMRSSAMPMTEKITSGRFHSMPPDMKPGDWLVNQSPQARRAYRILEIGEEGPSGYRRLTMESHPIDAVPEDARAIVFHWDKR